MEFKEKKKRLFELYASFEKAALPYLESAACQKGCADCCTNVGDVDVSTLEALLILEQMKSLSPSAQKILSKKLKKSRQLKEDSKYVPCAFLNEDRTCSIYAVRPFSCRRLYSIRMCGETGPTVHRDVWKLAAEIERQIRSLDDTGYCGHLSYVLQLLKDARFLKTYLSGGFSPDDVREFASGHGIVINRFAEYSGRDAEGGMPRYAFFLK